MTGTCDYCGERGEVREIENLGFNAIEQYCETCMEDFAESRCVSDVSDDDGEREPIETYTNDDAGADGTGFGDPPSEGRRERIMGW